jgi:DNA gyrase/topoisomerase IV subunit A
LEAIEKNITAKIITMKTTEKTGPVIGALTVKDEDEIMLITEKGPISSPYFYLIRHVAT